MRVEAATSLSIIIVNWNTRELLAQCIDSIYHYPPAVGFEVIVVDNASTDGSVAMVRERFPDVVVIENEQNRGFAAANNQAIKVAKGECVLLLNSDTVILPRTLEPLIRVLEGELRAGFVGPTLLNGDGSFQASYADFPKLTREVLAQFGIARLIWGSTYPSHGPEVRSVPKPVDWVGGACLLVRRACWEDIGLLDESIVMYGEEVDWCYRGWKSGWLTIHCPESEVIHYGGQSSVGFRARQYQLIQQGRVSFFRKHRSRVSLRLMILTVRVTNFLKALQCAMPFLCSPEQLTRRDIYLSAARADY